MNKLLLLGASAMLLGACSNTQSEEAHESSDTIETVANGQEITTARTTDGFIDFDKGLDGDYLIPTKDNYIDVSGITPGGNTLSVIYDGTVIDTIDVDSEGYFEYYANGGNEETNITFSVDKNLKIGDSVTFDSLEHYEVYGFIPNESSSANADEPSSQITLGINEEAIITDYEDNPIYSIKITKATKNLSRTDDIYTDGKPENTIEVTYEYKNYSYEALLEVNSQFLSVYNSEGVAGNKVGMQDGQTEVPDGKVATATTWFVMPEPVDDLDTIEIVYGGDFSLEFEDYVTFEVPLE